MKNSNTRYVDAPLSGAAGRGTGSAVAAAGRELPDDKARAATARLIARPGVQRLVAAALVGVGYFCGTQIGFVLTFQPNPISTLWPPNAILLAALLLTAPRYWWQLILAVFLAHLAAQLQIGIPTIQVLAWFVSNCSQALIGALCIRWFTSGPPRFDSLRYVSIFVAFGALLAPFLSSFIDIILVTVIGWAQGSFWDLWRMRFSSNVLAALALVPVIVTCATAGLPAIRRATPWRYVEVGTLTLGLLAVCFAVFIDGDFVSSSTPVLLYAPVPLLLWAAVRLGPLGTSTSLLAVACFAIWGAIHGQGPFVTTSPAESALSVQLFLSALSIPLLFLAAVVEESGATEIALRTSEERLAKAFRSSPDAMVITRRSDGKVVDVNDRWQSLFGYARAEAVGTLLFELGIYPSAKDRAALIEAIGHDYVRDLAVDLRTRSGVNLHTLVAAEITEIGGEACHIWIIRDATAQWRAEQETQTQRREMLYLTRVAMLGQLSGALAHELNQPLTAILFNAQAAQKFLARRPVDLDELREILGDIVDDDKRAGEVIRRLRALLKRGETQFHVLDVNEVVREALDLAHGDFVARSVTVATRLARGLPVVQGDRIQVQQVLLNLLVNASEAMGAIEREERRLVVVTQADGVRGAQISVADRGPGIPADRLDKLFEPFFTTKEHGLGLGLSISRSIVAAHAGRLWAENNPDGGATFRVAFPAAHAAKSL